MDLLDEITRDESFERNIRFFKRLLYVAACILIVGLVFMWWYTSYTNKIIQEKVELSDRIFKVMLGSETNKVAELESIVSDTKNLPSKELANLYMAIVQIKAKQTNDAKICLQKILEKKSYTSLTTHYAAFLLLNLGIDNPELLEEKEMVKYFDMFSDKKAPIRLNAMILKGLWLYKNQKLPEAKAVLKNILDESKSRNDLVITNTRALLANISSSKQDKN